MYYQMQDWSSVKNILVIRPDNMGDLIMSGPAIRALKQGLNANITVLTSSMAAGVAAFMPEINDVIIFDIPWVKTQAALQPESLFELVTQLKDRQFDAAVIFTVYSQNPLPSAMIAYQAGISKILAYCRENPYGLITNWVVDKEPYQYIIHQVERDLKLVSEVCPIKSDTKLFVRVDEDLSQMVDNKLNDFGLDINEPWLILHAGVSEQKRQLPQTIWIDAAKQLIASGYKILVTGSKGESDLTSHLQQAIGEGAIDTAGLFSIGELIALISKAPLLLTVNTGTVHLAAATGTPVVVLYAQTNPQHTPWKVPNKVIEFPVPAGLKSMNEIIRFVDEKLYAQPAPMPTATTIVEAVTRLLRQPVPTAQPAL